MRLLRSLLVLGVLGLVLPVCAADLNVTAANVVKGNAAQTDTSRLAGEAIVAGETVYLKTSDNKYYRADADDTAATAATAGIALNTAPARASPSSSAPAATSTRAPRSPSARFTCSRATPARSPPSTTWPPSTSPPSSASAPARRISA